jgi:hypothetical protein
LTVTQFVTHHRSEAAIHRWDITGSDDLSDELLAQPELTRHAVSVLNSMPILNKYARTRAAQGHRLAPGRRHPVTPSPRYLISAL